MMSSLGSDKARGPREKALAAATHTTQPQKQIQVSHYRQQQYPQSFAGGRFVASPPPRVPDHLGIFADLSCRRLPSRSDLLR